MGKIVSKIKTTMEHKNGLRKFVPICRKLGIVHFLHCISNCLERKKNKYDRQEFLKFLNTHKADFEMLMEMLEDDFSKQTLQSILRYRTNWKLKELKNVIVKPQYFQKDIFKPCKNEVFVDGGAYTGDTILEFIKKFAYGGV